MPAGVTIETWHWVAFIGCVLFMLAVDLGLLHRKSREIHAREAAAWTFFVVFPLDGVCLCAVSMDGG